MSDVVQAPKLSKKEIQTELYRRGELKWKMHALQRRIYEQFLTSEENSTHVWLLARQSGKSFLLAFIAISEAIKNKNVIIKLLTDTKLHVRTIFEPIFREILEDCPEDVRPEYIPSQYVYIFPNGSQIQLAGSDGNSAERLRGQRSHLVLVDEAGFCNRLNYTVKSILFPTTTHTGGRIILASSPPENIDHDFVGFIEKAEMNNRLSRFTLWDNPLLSDEKKNQIISEFPGGVNDIQFRREYMCELVKDEEKSVFPEATEELLTEITKEHQRPPFLEPIVAMDLGFKDLTVVLFGYYDFRADKIVIEDEIVKFGKELKLPDFTKEVLDKEEALWTNPLTNEVNRPAVRVSDINYIVTQEIARISSGQLTFIAARKEPGYKLPMINQVRVMLANRRIVIHPRCTTLVRHLKNCRWKDATEKDEFSRSPDQGHYDACDALIYLIKHMNFQKNPYPAHYQLNPANIHYPSNYIHNKKQDNPKEIFARIFGVKKTKKAH